MPAMLCATSPISVAADDPASKTSQLKVGFRFLLCAVEQKWNGYMDRVFDEEVYDLHMMYKLGQ